VRQICTRELSESDVTACRFARVLRLGTKSVGALYIACDSRKNKLDLWSVDAIASLTTIALERAHSFVAESNAEAAKRSEELRSTILDGLAHSFKTPLSTIQSASSGLLEINRLDVAERELASLIDEETTRLAELIKQMLETSRLEAGQIEVEREWIEVDQLIQICRDEASQALASHPLLTVGKKGIEVWADFRLLLMAISQIIDNASKYASPASPITLGVTSTDHEVIFSVQNEGSFIVQEERLRIFRRFYRSPGSHHKAPGNASDCP
jgi:two-component system sensor histidine kinase KdpD